MISVTSGLSLKLYLNSLVYHRNIFGSSSKVFGNLRTSSEIFGNSREMFGNVRLVFGTILENLRKCSESDRKSSENHQKCRYPGGLEALPMIQRVKVRASFHRCKQNVVIIQGHSQVSLGCYFDLVRCGDLKAGCIFCSCFKENVK